MKENRNASIVDVALREITDAFHLPAGFGDLSSPHSVSDVAPLMNE